jgi:RNA polymerase sigma-54 factor
MKPSLQLKLSQHLALTPQLQQSIRLLQLSTLELNQEVDRILQDNPLLEREDEDEEAPGPFTGETETYTRTYESEASAPADAKLTADRFDSSDTDWMEDEGSYGNPRDEDGEEPGFTQVAADSPTLRVHLGGQMALMQLSERDRRLVQLLIDALDEDGYLSMELDELQGMLPAELDIDLDDLQVALRHVQHMDPPGVGARNLKECLLLQLQAMPADTPYRDAAIKVVGQHLEALASRDYQKLRRALACDDACLREVQAMIIRLNPRPGSDYAQVDTRYVIPDVVVRKIKGVWSASLNPDAMPKLRINRLYADILSRNRDASGQQLASQLQEAKWLIKNVQQRFETILRVAQAIVDRQRHFFEHGEVAMRPLVLREIAETLGLHESTVSRVTTQKFMLTPRGTFELKYFFGSHVQTETGGACSATAIRALIKQLVGAEDTRRPLSDSQISEILGQQGIMVARRTVAKYRESMQILPANLRKSL